MNNGVNASNTHLGSNQQLCQVKLELWDLEAHSAHRPATPVPGPSHRPFLLLTQPRRQEITWRTGKVDFGPWQ